MFAALIGRFGFRKTPVGLTPFVVFYSTTFYGCWPLLRKAPLRNRKTLVTLNVMRNINEFSLEQKNLLTIRC